MSKSAGAPVMSSAQELGPCPFCESTDIGTDFDLRTRFDVVFCDDCGATLSDDPETGTSAFAAWNRRPSLEAKDAEIAKLKADAVYMAKLLVLVRKRLVHVTDHIEDEGDRTYFGSSNDADALKELYRSLDDFDWSLILDRKKGRDLYAEMRKLRREKAATEARLAEAMEQLDTLRLDRDRLDFLDECNRRLNESYGTTYRWELILNHNVNRLMIRNLDIDLNDAKAHGWPSCREAIDRELLRVTASRRARSVLSGERPSPAKDQPE